MTEVVLVGAGRVRGLGLGIELDAVPLGAADHLPLGLVVERPPGRRVVDPLLQEEHRAAGAGQPVRHQRVAGRAREGRVLGAVLEAGEVAVPVVGPAPELAGRSGVRRQPAQRVQGRVEDDVVACCREPQREVVLGGRHREAVGADDVRLEAGQPLRHRAGGDPSPDLGAKARHDVRGGHRGLPLGQVRQHPYRSHRVGGCGQVELDVGVGGGADGEDARLR
jgi:hypothetical protein